MLKNSIEQGWAQVKKMAQHPKEGITLDELLHELKFWRGIFHRIRYFAKK